MNILLISTYELGRQPFGLASPAAQLHAEGHKVRCLDLSVERLDDDAVGEAGLIAFYLPMHTATRIALPVIDRVRARNTRAHVCGYGLYAPISAEVLQERGVASIFGGEFEPGLRALARHLDAAGHGRTNDAELGRVGQSGARSRGDARIGGTAPRPENAPPHVSWQRQQFAVPRRTGLPPLTAYARLVGTDGARRTVGYTETSRGCKHLCRHCPVVPVYQGRFRVVQSEVVAADVDQQVAAGAQHITFGDPDFFNGPRHAIEVVRALHARHPHLSYDVTIKVEHLLRHAELLPVLRHTGCAFVTSAIEAVDDAILAKLAKGHTRANFERVVTLCADAGLALQPTFVAFNPWISLAGYRELLATLARLDLIDNVPSIQLAIRLLIPGGSRLLELADVRELVGPFDPAVLGYRWRHPDARVDALQRDIEALVSRAGEDADRRALFERAWERAHAAEDGPRLELPDVAPGRARATVPYLTEPWYC